MARPNVRLALIVAIACACALAWGCTTTAGTASSSSADAPSSGAPSSASPPASSSSASFSPTSTAEPSAVPEATAILGEDEWGDLLESLGPDAVAFGRRVQGELPQTAYAQWSGEGGGEPVEFTEPAQIRALFNALASAGVGEEAKEVRTDDYTSFWFVFADGGRFSFNFDSMAVDLPDDNSYVEYSVLAGDDLQAFAAIAQAHTLESYMD